MRGRCPHRLCRCSEMYASTAAGSVCTNERYVHFDARRCHRQNDTPFTQVDRFVCHEQVDDSLMTVWDECWVNIIMQACRVNDFLGS